MGYLTTVTFSMACLVAAPRTRAGALRRAVPAGAYGVLPVPRLGDDEVRKPVARAQRGRQEQGAHGGVGHRAARQRRRVPACLSRARFRRAGACHRGGLCRHDGRAALAEACARSGGTFATCWICGASPSIAPAWWARRSWPLAQRGCSGPSVLHGGSVPPWLRCS